VGVLWGMILGQWPNFSEKKFEAPIHPPMVATFGHSQKQINQLLHSKKKQSNL
jgi:hypothetical protein